MGRCFDLNTAIATWRQFQASHHRFLEEDLDELEVHLRAHITDLRKVGWSADEAFREAVKSLGNPDETETEYRKVRLGKLKRKQRLTDELKWRGSMLKNYVKIILRNARRRPGYIFINVMGLAVGMACCLLIALYVQEELNHDRHHPDHEQVYRVAFDIKTATSNRVFANGPSPLAPALLENYPQVEEAARLWKLGGILVQRDLERRSYEDNLFFADPSIFEIFSLPFQYGDAETALTQPETVVISALMAMKYFGDENPIGNILTIDGTEYKITGVLQQPVHNSHITFDFISSFVPVEARSPWMQNWHLTMFHTYVKLHESADVDAFGAELEIIAERYVAEDLRRFESTYHFFLQPVADIHLHSNLVGELEAPGNIAYLYIFSVVAILILLIASLNYINLTTAQSAKRAKEIGVRKAVGSGRGQLVRQFLSESVALAAIASILALGIMLLALPWFNTVTGYQINFESFLQPAVLAGAALLIAVTGGLAGFFPAFILSSIHPLRILKGQFRSSKHGVLLRKVLVMGQFTITLVLIAGTITAYKQLDYMKSAPLGFDDDQVLVLPRVSSGDDFEQLKAEWLRDTEIKMATASSSVPGRGVDNFAIRLLGEEDQKLQSMYHLFIDFDFIDTYDIEIIAGRGLQKELTSDLEGGFLINEAGLSAFGWQSPEEALGKRVESGGVWPGEIIGVYRDFNYRFLHHSVEPLMLTVMPDRFYYISLKLATSDVPSTLNQVEQTWMQLFPDLPFEYFFLDEAFNQQYQADEKTAWLMLVFASLAILIACLGLLGLAAFAAQAYRKEIGVRKVLGASVAHVIALLAKDFIQLVLLAILIGTPLAWFVTNWWLGGFAYRIEASLWTFVLAGLMALGIALFTVSYQSIKTALVNPVISLRNE